MNSGTYKWTLTLVTALVVGVGGAVVRPALPGLPADHGSGVSGQIIVNEGGGNILLIDPTGRLPAERVALPPRIRDLHHRQMLNPDISLIAMGDVWWDEREDVFDAVSGLTSATGTPLVIDSAVSQFYGDGTPRSIALATSNEALASVTTSPIDDRFAIAGDTLLPDDGRIGILEPDGTQRTLTHDSSGPVSWSSDGTRLAYACSIQHESPQLCVYDLMKHTQQVYALPGVGAVVTPAISPDGHTVALIADVGSNLATDLVIVSLMDGRVHVLTDDSRQKASPQWSPSGAVIAYATPRTIVLHAMSTDQEVSIADFRAVASLQWVSSARDAFGRT